MSELQTIFDWLPHTLEQRGHPGTHVYQGSVREDGNWYYIPIYVPLPDAYEKAVLLQSVEDQWEAQEPQPQHRILLIPAAQR